MAMSQSSRRGLTVTMGFAVVIAVLLLVAYFSRDLRSPEQACAQKCAAVNKQGHLVYKGPATSKDFYKQANSVCECR